MPAPTAALTSSFNEARSPLTAANVQAWASDHFPDPLQALPRPSRVKWIQFDDDSFTVTRAVWRGLGRSAHNHLLVIGGYAPGPDIEEPTERVAAHVHTDEADVSFFRITADNELLPVKSTSTVAFHAPFCDVGDDAGNSKAIHRVSALILYYFLAAGHVTELQRTRADPSMFTRTFRDACYWVANSGERPVIPHLRPNAVARSSAVLDDVPVRPKRSSTMSTRPRGCSAPCCLDSDSLQPPCPRPRTQPTPPRPSAAPSPTTSRSSATAKTTPFCAPRSTPAAP